MLTSNIGVWKVVVALAVGLGATWSAETAAGQRALLVGVGEYTDEKINDLAGPAEDVALIAEILQSAGYSKNEIRTLTDGQATKSAIVAAWKVWLVQGTEAGDDVFFFFSGHGTQLPDFNHDEGGGVFERLDEALVPADFNSKSPDAGRLLVDDEIEGLLSELAGRKVTVILDNCHSGTGVKGLGDAGTRALGAFAPQEKWTPVGRMVTKPFESSVLGTTLDKPLSDRQRANLARVRSDLLVLSASGPQQVSITMVVPPMRPKIDPLTGKYRWHGAFSYALALGLEGPADRDGNGAVTYGEALDYAAREMRTTYGLLQDPEFDGARRRLKEVVKRVPKTEAGGHSFSEKPLRVMVATRDEAFTKALEQSLGRLPKILITRKDSDFDRVVYEMDDQTYLAVARRTGGLEAVIPRGSVAEATADLRPVLQRAIVAEKAMSLAQTDPGFRFDIGVFNQRDPNLLDVALSGALSGGAQARRGSRRFTHGEKLYFHGRSEKPAHLLLMHVQSNGRVFVLLPNKKMPDATLDPGRVLVFPDAELEREHQFSVTVDAPYGEDLVMGIATSDPLDLQALGLKELGLAASEIGGRSKPDRRLTATGDFLSKLADQLDKRGSAWSEDRVVFWTGKD